MEIDDYIIATDQELVSLVLDGDQTAFEHLFNRYRGSIHQLFIQRTNGNEDDTNDLLQETFIKVFLNIHLYNSIYTFGQWIYAIARNTFVDYVRRRREKTVSIDNTQESIARTLMSNSKTPEESMISEQTSARIDAMITKMDPKYRVLIEMRFLKEFSYEEIAAELEIPLGTVKTQIHRAREQICRLITENDDQK